MEQRDYGVVAWAWGDDACDVEHWCVCEVTEGVADEWGELAEKSCSCRAPRLGVPCGDPIVKTQYRHFQRCLDGLTCDEASDGQLRCVPWPDGATPSTERDAATE